MEKYEARRKVVEAQQWDGDLENFDVVKLRIIEGVGGYAAKLAYYDRENGTSMTVRPNEFVVKHGDGRVVTMTEDEFNEVYTVAKSSKSANNKQKSKTDEDNVGFMPAPSKTA